MRTEQVRRNGFACWKRVELFHVDHRKGRSKRIVESALRNAAMQRHLAAFKTAAARIAAARLLPLVTGAGSFAELRTHAAANAYLSPAGAARGSKIRKADSRFLFAGLFCHDLFHHFHEMSHLMDHTACFRRVLALDDLMQ